MKVYSLLGFTDYEGSDLVGVFGSLSALLVCVAEGGGKWSHDDMGYVESELGEKIDDVLGVIPEFISTYNSRKFAFPHLVQPNDKGKHVLFGGFAKDTDKKVIIWELVAKREPQIDWGYTKNNTLKKENYDMSDAYACALGYMKSKEIW